MPESCTDALSAAVAGALACRRCEAFLPLGARPVFRVSSTARILISSQAPGTKVHMTGLPFNDASGDRLRGWLQMDRDLFYDESRIAIVPMGLCYPGRLPNGGDAPPRPECAPLWLDRFTRLMPQVRLTLLVGSYALRHRLGKGAMTEQVKSISGTGASDHAAATSVLAHHGMGAPQSVVRRRVNPQVEAGGDRGLVIEFERGRCGHGALSPYARESSCRPPRLVFGR